MEPSLLVSIRDAAAQLSCSKATVWEWLSEGRLQRVKVGRFTLIRREEIEAIVRLGGRQQGGCNNDQALADLHFTYGEI